VWETPQEGFCGHSVPYLATFPRSGSMRNGRLFRPRMPVAATSVSGYLSWPGRAELPLFRTPTAQLAVNGGSQHPDKRRAGGHGPTLADEVEHLLPELSARTWTLLPTPGARDYRSGKSNLMEANARPLNEVAENLPRQAGIVDWAQFARAVLRWQQVIGRAVPYPLIRGRDDAGRLSAEFVEWMMGLEHGRVTAVPGLTHPDKLKVLGNGVVPQQGRLALRILLGRLQAAAEAA
jgi:hypothetical protein